MGVAKTSIGGEGGEVRVGGLRDLLLSIAAKGFVDGEVLELRLFLRL